MKCVKLVHTLFNICYFAHTLWFFISAYLLQAQLEVVGYVIDKAPWVYYKTNLYSKCLDVVDMILNEIGANKSFLSFID